MTSFRGPSKTQVTERDKSIYICTRSAHFFCFAQFTNQRMLISHKVQCRTRWNIQNHVPNVTSRSSNEKWAIAWENLSFGIGFTKEASGSIIRMRGSRGPDPPCSLLTFAPSPPPPPPWKNLHPLPCKMLDSLWNLKKYSFPWNKPLIPLCKTVKKLMHEKRYQSFFSDPPPLPPGENSWIGAWYYHNANSVGCTCSSLPTLITYVVSTSRLFTKYPGTIAYGAPRKLISCSGSIGNIIKQSIFLSLHGSVSEFCNDRTEYLRRIGDIGVKSASARRTFRKQILMSSKTCDVNADFTLTT